MKRVWMFIDGYNFYYSVKDYDRDQFAAGNGHKIYLGWTNFRMLAEKYMLPHIGEDCQLTKILYFTAEVKHLGTSFGEADRQSLWLKAVGAIGGLEVYYGFHKAMLDVKCEHRCRDHSGKRVEKQTDVNIGVQLALGAAFDQYDAAILLCNDIDQIPAIEAVTSDTRINSPKTVHIWTPLGTDRANKLSKLDKEQHHVVTQEMLMETRLPEKFFDKKGNGPFECLPEWKAPRTPTV